MKFNFQSLILKTRKLIPVPNYLKMPACAFDISDNSIKYMELEPYSDFFIPKNYEKKTIKKGTIQDGVISNKEELTNILIYFKEKYPKQEFANINLPEEMAFAFSLDASNINKDTDTRAYIESHLQENLPIPAKNTIFDYRILNFGKNLRVYVLAYPKALVEDYISVFEDAGFKVKHAELETLSMARAIIPKSKINSTSVVIDIGNSKLGISAFRELTPVFTSTIKHPIGKEFKELYRKTHEGKEPINAIEFFDWKFKEGIALASANLTRDFMQSALDKTSNILAYLEESEQIKIDAIYLSGGNSATKGIDSFFSAKLKKPVFLGNTWENLFDLEKYLPSVNYKESFMYSTLVGLLLADKNSI